MQANCYVQTIIEECLKQEIGYELSVKANLYNLLVVLFRKYVDKCMTDKQLECRINKFERFNKIFEYIEANYHKAISITGKTITEYINEIRLKKSIELLK